MADDPNERSRRLVHVRYAAAAMVECAHSLHDAVQDALRAGASWSQIAEAQGLSREEAQRQYADQGVSGRS